MIIWNFTGLSVARICFSFEDTIACIDNPFALVNSANMWISKQSSELFIVTDHYHFVRHG